MKSPRIKLLRRLFKVLTISVGSLMMLILILNLWVIEETNDLIYYRVDEVPSRKVALLLGTSKRTEAGGTNKYFKERIEAAAQLYHQGVIKHIIVSGTNNSVYYNEPKDMYNALAERGVDKGDITFDFAGFRTLDSVVRSKLIFGQDEVMIITQDFHCYRALFIAQYYDIDAIAFSADNKDALPMNLAVREVLARVVAVLDLYMFKKTPKYLGREEELTID